MKITQKRLWSWQNVFQMCYDECYCTLATYDDYDKLMNYIKEHKNPTDKDIYKVAKDIKEYSPNKEEQVRDIMYKLANEVVKYIYEVEE